MTGFEPEGPPAAATDGGGGLRYCGHAERGEWIGLGGGECLAEDGDLLGEGPAGSLLGEGAGGEFFEVASQGAGAAFDVLGVSGGRGRFVVQGGGPVRRQR